MSTTAREVFANESVAIPYDWPKDQPYIPQKKSATMLDMEYVIRQAAVENSMAGSNNNDLKYKRYYEGFIDNQIKHLKNQIVKKKKQIVKIEHEISNWELEKLK